MRFYDREKEDGRGACDISGQQSGNPQQGTSKISSHPDRPVNRRYVRKIHRAKRLHFKGVILQPKTKLSIINVMSKDNKLYFCNW